MLAPIAKIWPAMLLRPATATEPVLVNLACALHHKQVAIGKHPIVIRVQQIILVPDAPCIAMVIIPAADMVFAHLTLHVLAIRTTSMVIGCKQIALTVNRDIMVPIVPQA